MARVDSDEKRATSSGVPGGDAARPAEIPKQGWFQIAKRGWAEAKADQVPLLAAGLAYYGFLAIFPAIVAGVLLYGFFADPAQLTAQVQQLSDALPAEARDLLVAQVQNMAGQRQGLGLGALVAILIALWSASGGMSNLMTAISTAYDEEEKRSFVKKRLIALGLTLAAIVFMVIMLGLVAVLPAIFSQASGPLVWLLQVVRWVVTAAVVAVALAVLYRICPDRDAPKFRWVSVGALVATVLFLLASLGFSLYVANFSNYAKTYGALAGIVVLLLWLFITSYAILLGAEINAEAEQQTVRDTTHGPDEPLGRRGAVKADSVPQGQPDKPGQEKKDRPKDRRESR